MPDSIKEIFDDLAGATDCEIKDDRSEDQKATHNRAVIARDTFMSGWGRAKGGYSFAAWACSPGADFDALWCWVKNREDMKNVREIDLADYGPESSAAHFHVYVCTENHPSQS